MMTSLASWWISTLRILSDKKWGLRRGVAAWYVDWVIVYMCTCYHGFEVSGSGAEVELMVVSDIDVKTIRSFKKVIYQECGWKEKEVEESRDCH